MRHRARYSLEPVLQTRRNRVVDSGAWPFQRRKVLGTAAVRAGSSCEGHAAKGLDQDGGRRLTPDNWKSELTDDSGTDAARKTTSRPVITLKRGLRRGVRHDLRSRPVRPNVEHLRLVEVHGRLGGTCKVFKATAEDAKGIQFQVAVKPAPDASTLAGHLYANWCGEFVAASLGVPTPGLYLVELDRAVLSALGPDYSGVEPGPALASRFQAGAIPCALMLPLPDIHNVRNGPDSVAAAFVLDTVFQNTDRGGDVLVVPTESGPVKYDLCFNDNGWLVWFPLPMYTNPLRPRPMTHPWLKAMAPTADQYNAPVFCAEALNGVAMRNAFGACPPSLKQGEVHPTPREVVQTLRARASGLRDVDFVDVLRRT